MCYLQLKTLACPPMPKPKVAARVRARRRLTSTPLPEQSLEIRQILRALEPSRSTLYGLIATVGGHGTPRFSRRPAPPRVRGRAGCTTLSPPGMTTQVAPWL